MIPPRTAHWPTSSTSGTTLEAPLLQGCHELTHVDLVADPDRLAELGEVRRNRDALLKRSGRGHQDTRAAGEESLHRFHPETADLEVWLGLLVGERFLLRVEV